MLVYLRNRKVERGYTAAGEKLAMKGFKMLMKSSGRFKQAVKLGQTGQKLLVRDGYIRSQFGPLKGWTAYRHIPALPSRSFRERWPQLDAEVGASLPPMPEAMKSRMESIVAGRKERGMKR